MQVLPSSQRMYVRVPWQVGRLYVRAPTSVTPPTCGIHPARNKMISQVGADLGGGGGGLGGGPPPPPRLTQLHTI